MRLLIYMERTIQIGKSIEFHPGDVKSSGTLELAGQPLHQLARFVELARTVDSEAAHPTYAELFEEDVDLHSRSVKNKIAGLAIGGDSLF